MNAYYFISALIIVVLIFLVVFGWKAIKGSGTKEEEESGDAGELPDDREPPMDNWADELEKIKAEKQSDRSEREAAVRKYELEEKKFVSQIDVMVTRLLSDMGRVQWGPDNYALVSGVEWGDPAWEVRRLVSKGAEDETAHGQYEVFTVRLRRTLGEFYFSSQAGSKREHSTQQGDVSEAGLKDMLRTVMRVGPGTKSEYEIL